MPALYITLFIMTGLECLFLIPFTRHYRRLDKAGKWAYYYLVASAVFAIGGYTTSWLGNNLWFAAIMSLLQFVILSRFYHLLIANPIVKKTVLALIAPMIIVFFLDFFWWEGPRQFNSIFWSTRAILLWLYGGIYTFQLLFDKNLVRQAVFVYSLPAFWFNAGLFIFHSASFLFALSYKHLLSQLPLVLDYFNYLFIVIYIAGIIEVIFFYIGLLKTRRKTVVT